jgi:hypothetical protein
MQSAQTPRRLHAYIFLLLAVLIYMVLPYGLPSVAAQGRVEDSSWVFIVHDLNPHAMAQKVKGFVQAQSWFQGLIPMWVEK